MHEIFSQIEQIFANIWQESRKTLLEPEIYRILQLLEFRTPAFAFVQDKKGLEPANWQHLPGNKVVAKVVSPDIFHKTDVGGVRIIPKTATELETVWQHFEQVCQKQNARFYGMILCELVEYHPGVFAQEILFGIRWSKDFGQIITVGLGGVETDLLGQLIQSEANVQNDLVPTTTFERFQKHLSNTLMYQKLSGKIRGSKRVISDDDFFKPLWRLVEFAKFCSPWGNGKFLLEEMEFNPIMAYQGQLLALDAKIRFNEMQGLRRRPNLQKIQKLLKPQSIGIVGVSSKAMNMGRIILNNIVQNGFAPDKIFVLKEGVDAIDGCRCFPDVEHLPSKTDLFVIAVNAAETPKIIEELLKYNRTESIIIIPGGMGEKEGEGQKIEAHLKEIVQQMPDAPVLVGPNCLGIRSIPGLYDTFFIPEHKLPKGRTLPNKIGFVSQSGAFVITKISKLNADFYYAISTGNQLDLGTSDYLGYFMDNPEIQLLAFYIEGFGYLDGLAFAEYAEKAIANGKKILCYKAGKTSQGQSAALGHTASVAGEYQVCKNILKNLGIFWVDSFQDFEDSLRLFTYLDQKQIQGNRVGLLSNAGFESVGMADSASPQGSPLEIPKLQPETIQKITEIYQKGKLLEIANIRNPLDITPSANDIVYEECAKALISASYIDAVIVSIVPFSPVTTTLEASSKHKENIDAETSLPQRLIRLAQTSNKPLLAVVDAGELYQPMVNLLEKHNIPVFRNADRAVRMLAQYITYRMHK